MCYSLRDADCPFRADLTSCLVGDVQCRLYPAFNIILLFNGRTLSPSVSVIIDHTFWMSVNRWCQIFQNCTYKTSSKHHLYSCMMLSKGRNECKGRFNSKLLFKVGKKVENLRLLVLSNFTYNYILRWTKYTYNITYNTTVS